MGNLTSDVKEKIASITSTLYGKIRPKQMASLFYAQRKEIQGVVNAAKKAEK